MAEDFDPKELRRLAEAFPERPLPANQRELEARDAFCDYVMRHKSVILSLIGSERTPSPPLRQDQPSREQIENLRIKFLRQLELDSYDRQSLGQIFDMASLSLAPEPILKGAVGERIDALRKWSASLFKEERILESQAVTETADLLAGLSTARSAVLEEAVQVALEYRDKVDEQRDLNGPECEVAHSMGQGFAANLLGKRIRALKSAAGSGET